MMEFLLSPSELVAGTIGRSLPGCIPRVMALSQTWAVDRKVVKLTLTPIPLLELLGSRHQIGISL